MSSVFDKFNKPSGNNMFNLLKQARNLQQNPALIADMLKKSGKINDDQYEHIKKMNSPKDIGEYLLNNNADFRKMYNGK